MIQRLYIISKEIKDKIPNPHRLIDKHYVLEIKKDNVCVFTRHPLEGYKSYLISNTTINQQPRSQYLTGIIYKIDSTNAKLSEAPEADFFEKENVSSIINFKQKINEFPIVDIAKLISGAE